ncbi:MAG: hypothetical protein FDX02_00060 [Chlorobium sp.]|nr:MAG: hypothetical protein FDX02_00060 [Chlorobium sp.]
MANSIALWYSNILQWAQVLAEPVRRSYPDSKKLTSRRADIQVAEGIGSGDDIISQMSKEYPTLFMT